MPIFRLESDSDIIRIAKDGFLKRSINTYTPYNKGEVICLLEMPTPNDAIQKYGHGIASNRQLKLNQKLYVLSIDKSIKNIELDRSQKGWPESRVYKSDIYIKHLSIVAEATILDTSGILKFSHTTVYEISKTFQEFL